MSRLDANSQRKLDLAIASGYTTAQVARIARVSRETARKRAIQITGRKRGHPYKLTEDQRAEILRRDAARAASRETLLSIALDFGVSESYITHLRKRRSS